MTNHSVFCWILDYCWFSRSQYIPSWELTHIVFPAAVFESMIFPLMFGGICDTSLEGNFEMIIIFVYICSDASKDSLFLLADSKIFISWRWKESLENDLRGFPKPLHLGPSDAWRIQPSKADPSGVIFFEFSFGISNCILHSGQISSRPHTTKNPKR